MRKINPDQRSPKPAVFTETLLRRSRLYQGAVGFCVDEVSLPDGRRAKREYLDHPGASAVVPFLDCNHIVMVRQYRYPVGKSTLEIPAGKLDLGERPLACARRELAEETGHRARNMKKITAFYPSPAFANEEIHIFAAWNLFSGNPHRDEDEFLRVEIISFDRALRQVREGKIKDSKTVIGLLACAISRPFSIAQ
ncbi:MAG: NUDIX domain-containing protein [Elusimicrobiota bacterium]